VRSAEQIIEDEEITRAAKIILAAAIYAKTQQSPNIPFENVPDKESLPRVLLAIEKSIHSARTAYFNVTKSNLEFTEKQAISDEIRNLLIETQITLISINSVDLHKRTVVLDEKQISIFLGSPSNNPDKIANKARVSSTLQMKENLDKECKDLEINCKELYEQLKKDINEKNGRKPNLAEKSEFLTLRMKEVHEISHQIDDIKNPDIKDEYKAKVETFLHRLPFLIGLDTAAKQTEIKTEFDSLKEKEKSGNKGVKETAEPGAIKRRQAKSNIDVEDIQHSIKAEQERQQKIDQKYAAFFSDLKKLSTYGNLAGTDLSNLDLTGFILIKHDLTNSNLNNTILTKADISYSNVQGANLGDANLMDCTITGVNLGAAKNLQGIILKRLDLQGQCFAFCDLTKANLQETKCIGVNFHNANCSETQFHYATLINADLSSANLFKTNCTEVNFKGANVTYAKNVLHAINPTFTGAIDKPDFNKKDTYTVIGCIIYHSPENGVEHPERPFNPPVDPSKAPQDKTTEKKFTDKFRSLTSKSSKPEKSESEKSHQKKEGERRDKKSDKSKHK
jgi:uncharacterized protein YjbI with pentapeptide repeats